MTFCTEPGCSRRAHSRGLCSMHYSRLRRSDPAELKARAAPKSCQHIRCPNAAKYRVIWPYPIRREELTCPAHTQRTRIAMIPSVIIKRIESK